MRYSTKNRRATKSNDLLVIVDIFVGCFRARARAPKLGAETGPGRKARAIFGARAPGTGPGEQQNTN